MTHKLSKTDMLLKDYLEKYHITMDELAKEAGLNRTTIFRFTTGCPASVKSARAVEKATNKQVTFEELRKKSPK